MSSRCLKILLAACLALVVAGCGASGTAAKTPRYGIVANAQDWDREQDFAKSTGAGWIREQFEWAKIEPRDDDWQWERYDALLTKSSKRGLRVLPLLIGTPDWAGPNWTHIPDDPSEFAEYVAKVTARYGPRGRFWRENPHLRRLAPRFFELWNEPYYSSYASNGVNPARYARLVKASAIAGRRANRRARFLLAADTGYSDPSDRYHFWIDELYSAEPKLGRYYDAVAVHPYSQGQAPQIYTPDGYTRDQVGRLVEVYDAIRRHGDRKRLWITELGWSTCPDHDWCVTERQQARYIKRTWKLANTRWRGIVAAVFFFHLRDYGHNPEFIDHWFGAIRADGSRKPSWKSLQTIARSD